MVFNSVSFFIFLPIFFILYFLLRNNLKFQNYLILVSSIIFYGFWDYRFVLLLVFNTVIDYYFGLALFDKKNRHKKKQILFWAVFINLGILFFFKYFNFFIHSFNIMAVSVGFHPNLGTLNILLPIGISFYTFHSLSYTIDIYHNKLRPTRNYVAYASFVCFFPQLVAGPISRARDMLPKFLTKRPINSEKMVSGISQITLGFFKKVAIADSIGVMVDTSFDLKHLHFVSDLQILLSAIFYSFQIYCDFSGYSDIALGLGKIFGIEFKMNFNRPYFAKNFSEFWERWHISLSSWLRDYLYIPLGGNRKGELFTYRNLMITMLLGGLWHGASFNFIIWGGLHGLYLVIQRQIKFKLPAPLAIFITFSLTTLAWVFFRSHSFADSIYIIERIFTMHSFQLYNAFIVFKIIYLIALLLILDAFFYNYFEKNNVRSFAINVFLILNILLMGTFSSNAFIYFQF
jgi:alginate O-acetyltransferase complex protein AlgI